VVRATASSGQFPSRSQRDKPRLHLAADAAQLATPKEAARDSAESLANGDPTQWIFNQQPPPSFLGGCAGRLIDRRPGIIRGNGGWVTTMPLIAPSLIGSFSPINWF